MSTEQMPLEDVLTGWRPADAPDWPAAFADAVEHAWLNIAVLLRDVDANGLREPILLGTDGRVWEGENRLLVARVLALPSVPVERGAADLRVGSGEAR